MRAMFAAALALVLTMASATGAQRTLSPNGAWQSSDGDTRFSVSLCGDGTQLCAKLVWLSSDLRTPDNVQYLNRYVVRRAVLTAENTWSGTVDLYGEQASGKIVMTGPNNIRLIGCRAILCQTVKFTRI